MRFTGLLEIARLQWSVEHLLNTTGSRIVDVYQSNQTFPKNSKYLLGFNEPNKLCALWCLCYAALTSSRANFACSLGLR